MEGDQNQGWQGNIQNTSGQVNGQMNGAAMSGRMLGSAKQPMDFAKKRKIALGVSLGVAGVVVLIVGVVVAVMLLRVDYGESYRIAKSLKPEIYDLAYDTNCANVLNFVKSEYTDLTKYDSYVEACKILGDGIDDAVNELGDSAGVKRNSEINIQYKKFKEILDTVVPDKAVLEEKLALYQAWRKFEVLKGELQASKSSDAEIRSTAQVLIGSGNPVLKEYGEGWLEKSLAYAQATRACNDVSYSDGIEQKSALLKEMNQKRSEQSTWAKENEPDITEVAGLEFDSMTKVYDEFKKLYDMIADEYERNYISGSGDCSELFGEVFCD